MIKTKTRHENNKAVKDEVDKFLIAIKLEKSNLDFVEARYQEELEAIKARFYPEIEKYKENIRKLESELEKFVKRHKAELFDGSDMVDTNVGRIIWQVKEAVKRAKGVLERLEELGWSEAIIIEKRVNWDELERWPDERLIACGTERVIKEKIVYEIKQIKQ